MARKRIKQTGEQIELWKRLAQGAFRAVLLGRHLSQKDAAAFRKARSDQVVFIDDAVSGEAVGTNSSDTVQASESFDLPWLPEKSVVPGLLAVLGIARAISSKNEIKAICSAGHLSQICLRGVSSDDDDNVGHTLQTAFEHWSDEFGTEDEPSQVYVKVAPNGTDGGGRANLSSLKSFRTNTVKHLRQGQAVAVISLDLAALDREFADICGLTLTPVPLSRDAMLELVRAVHAPSMSVEDAFLLEHFPEDQVLARKSATQIETALRQTTVDAMLARLNLPVKRAVRSSMVTLDNVHGQDAAVRAFKRILEDVELWKAGRVQWSAVSANAVMFGPPGNGKTMLAEAVAGSAGVPFVATSYSECQAFGHQGDMLKALGQAFETAKNEAPSVLFIDEIDSFSQRGSDKQNEGYLRGVVNGLLTEVSRAVKTPGVILLAATNDLAVVDPAVIRPGRFDIKIPIRNPDHAGIANILLSHLGANNFDEADLDDLFGIARQLVGCSGAEAASIARQALGYARAEDRSVTVADVRLASSSLADDDADFLFRKAIHEAGHAIVRLHCSLPRPTLIRLSKTETFVEAPVPRYFTEDKVCEELRVLLAGRAAEQICLGSVSSGAGDGPQSDQARATLLALKIEVEWSLEKIAPWTASEMLMTVGMSNELKARVSKRLEKAEAEALEVLTENKDKLLALANELLRVREMTEPEILRIVSAEFRTLI